MRPTESLQLQLSCPSTREHGEVGRLPRDGQGHGERVQHDRCVRVVAEVRRRGENTIVGQMQTGGDAGFGHVIDGPTHERHAPLGPSHLVSGGAKTR